MTHKPSEFDSYWQAVEDEVTALSESPVQVEEIPLRSNEVSTAFAVRFSGVEGYPLFAYLSVPKSERPSPALFQAPGYGSVVTVPAYERRGRYTVMALCHRGQRLSDSPYSAAYPGLLTEGLPDAGTYRWREIVADCLRALDVLKARPEADTSRLAVVGNDLAAITAALRPETRVLLLSGLLFRDIPGRLDLLDAYPLQEFADYMRANPSHREGVFHTLALFDPLAFASRIAADTLITCGEGERPHAEPLIEMLGTKASLKVHSGYGYLDHQFEATWLEENTGV